MGLRIFGYSIGVIFFRFVWTNPVLVLCLGFLWMLFSSLYQVYKMDKKVK